VTGARVLGLLLMIACAGATFWLLTADTFRLDTPQLSANLSYTDPQAVLAAAGVGTGQHPNVVGLRTDAMARAIASFPAVADVDVTTSLPNNVSISVAERVPVMAVQRAGSTYLVDADGLVLAEVDPARAAALNLPTFDDQRTKLVEDITVGGTLDPIDLQAMLQIGAITPALIDSTATSLTLGVNDDDGYVINAQPNGWQAVFGEYTPNLRPVDIIPRQVQCLRSLLGTQETTVQTIYLAPLDEGCGTFLATPTPRALPSPASAR
jgi:cell division septal protein FtsQ